MEQVGVEAVVEGLQSFLGDMKQVNSALDGLRPSGTLLEQMFNSVSEAVGSFGREVLNVVETALGVMLRDAIEWIIRSLGELIQSIIETGNQFQLLKIRLTGLNLNEFADGTRSFAEAMGLAGKQTAAEIEWLQTLGALTPFDPAQIANTYTQARAFGFTADEAKRLTRDIIDYTAAMGLSNETLFLVIQNLGQMVQRGKITGTEIRDLARGSFLPLNDVLQRIAKNMGITIQELTKKISTPAGVPASEFVKAFEEMVENEPRFIGAAGRLARAFVPASQNVKELITSIFGLNVVTPIFDVLGEAVAKVVDVFVTFNEQGDLIKTGFWDNLVAAATNLGIAVSAVVKDILGLAPSAEGLANGLINAIQGLADWIKANKENIVGFFRSIGDFIFGKLIPALVSLVKWVWNHMGDFAAFFGGIANIIVNTVVPFVRDQLIPAFNRISEWVTTNRETINEFFAALGDIIIQVFGDLVGKGTESGDVLDTLLGYVRAFMEYVIANKDQIAEWVALLIKVWLAFEAIKIAINFVIGIVAALVGGLIALIGIIVGVISAIGFIVANFWVFIGILGAAVFAVFEFVQAVYTILMIRAIVDFINNVFAPGLVNAFEYIKNKVITAFQTLVTSVRNIDWVGLGRGIIESIGQGISNAAAWLASVVHDAVMAAYERALAALGLASGSGASANMPSSALPSTAAPASSASAMSMVNRSISTALTNNFNLTVNSSARQEPIIQDFHFLQSLAGV